jgi:hypothetical protein
MRNRISILPPEMEGVLTDGGNMAKDGGSVDNQQS